jgi:hypothetical protein
MPLKKVFLCHSSSDKLFVDRLASDLEKVNVGVWYDKWEIKVGDSLIEKMQEGLKNNDYLSIILSPESVNSEWVRRELNSALVKEIKEKKIFVLPCLLRNCSIPTFLAEKRYADFRDSYEDGFTDLLLAIIPESKEVAIRSRDFRVVQYLISGLTNTDSSGSNVLNAYQLIKVFPFRKELKGYLGLDEKKLLFYSAVGFKSANPDTPDLINNNVPVWGLIDEVDDLIRSQWLVEGMNPKIFGYLARHFKWAITINKSIDFAKVRDSFLEAHQLLDPTHDDTVTNIETKIHLLKLFAKYEPKDFVKYYIKKKTTNPGIIEASSELPDPLDIDYYLHLYRDHKEPEIVASIIKSLIKLKEPLAVQILSENYNNMKSDVSNREILNMFHAKEFGSELRTWLEKCSDLDDKIDIIGALGNCSFNIIDELDKMIAKYDKIKANDVALIRIIGCYGNKSHVEFLISKFGSKKNTVLSEAIIYAIGRLLKENSIDYLNDWYKTKGSNLIRAAAIETMARFNTEIINNELVNILNYKDNPYMLSALIRATEISKSIRWKDYLPQLFNHPSWFIRLCSARAASVMADYEFSMGILDENYDNTVKSVFDESLYCREPFRPDWLSRPYSFDMELARFSIRLTWPDQPIVYLQRNLDVNRKFSQLALHKEY